MTTVIRATAAPGFIEDHPAVGGYLAAYDPERACAHPSHDPAGQMGPTWAASPDDAMQFPDGRDAFLTWTAVAPCHPVRPDGKPNKPLTAWTVTMEDAP